MLEIENRMKLKEIIKQGLTHLDRTLYAMNIYGELQREIIYQTLPVAFPLPKFTRFLNMHIKCKRIYYKI